MSQVSRAAVHKRLLKIFKDKKHNLYKYHIGQYINNNDYDSMMSMTDEELLEDFIKNIK